MIWHPLNQRISAQQNKFLHGLSLTIMDSKNLLIELSHTIENGLITYKGLPAPIICDYLNREASKEKYDDATFQIGKIEMVGNTGTYLDCPFHRYEDGKDFTQVILSCFVDLDAIVIRIPHTETLEIDKKHIKGFDIKGKAVLFNTGWDRFWNTEQYYENHPYLNEQGALYLKEQKAVLVGIDSLNMDNSTNNRKRPVHTILLGAEILIVEHLCNLGALPMSGFTFTAVPPKIKGIGTLPVRAFATLKD
jgi:arylformamidase